ncbi:MAG TPA: HEAT repeat domain-containing protein [Candidatus Tumulicola sp.]|nr:HEAT repeat domain-containing protein [Candidatus Tumulicola sp.]
MTIDFSVLIAVVYWVAAAVGVASFLLTFQVTAMRVLGRARTQHLERFEATWKAILDGPPQPIDQLPGVEAADLTVLMILWNEAQEAALSRDAGRDAKRRSYLNEIAGHTGLGQSALHRLRGRDLARRLSAITLLGHFGERSATPALTGFVLSPSALISFASARALLQIDSVEAGRFVALMVERTDWSPFKLLSVVRQETASLVEPLVAAVQEFPPAASSRLIPYLAFFDAAKAMPAIRRVLETGADAEQIREALKVLGAIAAATDAGLAGKFATHPDWRVRVQAANAIGRLGRKTQAPILTALLGDTHWWVRYRAAEALAKLNAVSSLQRLLEKHPDRFARDVLRQVIGERELAARSGGA